MKKVIAMIVFVFVAVSLVGCNGKTPIIAPNPFVPDARCTEDAQKIVQGRESLILQKIPNPCAAHNILVVMGQSAALWEAFERAEFEKWATNLELLISSGMSYSGLQALLVKEISKFNDKLGKQLLIMSGLIFIFPEQHLILSADIDLLKWSLNDLKNKVSLMLI